MHLWGFVGPFLVSDIRRQISDVRPGLFWCLVSGVWCLVSDPRFPLQHPAHGAYLGPMDAYIVYGSHHGRAAQAAEALRRAANAEGLDVEASTMANADTAQISAARMLMVGCGAKVDTPFGGRPAALASSWIDGLPELEGKPVGVFCTYRFFPHTFADVTARTAEVIDGITRRVEEKGGRVVASKAMLHRRLEADAVALVGELGENAAA